MQTDVSCCRCGGHNLEPGSVQSAGDVSFRPGNSRFLTLLPGNVTLTATMCMDCGTIELAGDVRKVAARIRRQNA